MGRNPKLTEEQRRKIRRLYRDERLSHGELAERFGVSKVVIQRTLAKEKEEVKR